MQHVVSYLLLVTSFVCAQVQPGVADGFTSQVSNKPACGKHCVTDVPGSVLPATLDSLQAFCTAYGDGSSWKSCIKTSCSNMTEATAWNSVNIVALCKAATDGPKTSTTAGPAVSGSATTTADNIASSGLTMTTSDAGSAATSTNGSDLVASATSSTGTPASGVSAASSATGTMKGTSLASKTRVASSTAVASKSVSSTASISGASTAAGVAGLALSLAAVLV
ncbi:hypothetical protein BC830DRAFT_1138594 [Chytriomyces sp. MP71]|nr:hypothetical protein BC830DRAFT_1138594 [Chytriomyces sp. MP71]